MDDDKLTLLNLAEQFEHWLNWGDGLQANFL